MSHARAWPACLRADLGRGAQPLEEEEEEEADAMAIDDEDTWHEEEDGEDIKIRPSLPLTYAPGRAVTPT